MSVHILPLVIIKGVHISFVPIPNHSSDRSGLPRGSSSNIRSGVVLISLVDRLLVLHGCPWLWGHTNPSSLAKFYHPPGDTTLWLLGNHRVMPFHLACWFAKILDTMFQFIIIFPSMAFITAQYQSIGQCLLFVSGCNASLPLIVYPSKVGAVQAAMEAF